tara:strand:+ start:146 stop:520 length:375 start_codon:yes stop_codon:yes gene_type:complete
MTKTKLPVHRFREEFVRKFVAVHPHFSFVKDGRVQIKRDKWWNPPRDISSLLINLVELKYLTQKAKGCKWKWDVEAISKGEKNLDPNRLQIFKLYNIGGDSTQGEKIVKNLDTLGELKWEKKSD